MEALSKLETDWTAANNSEACRPAREREDRAVGLRHRLYEAGDGRDARSGTCGNDDVLRGEHPSINADRGRGFERGIAPVEVDAVRTHAAVGVGATHEELRRVDARYDFVPTHASLRRFLR